MRACSKRNKTKVWKETYGVSIRRRQSRDATKAMIRRHMFVSPETIGTDYSLGAHLWVGMKPSV